MANVAERLFGVIYLCGSTDISLRIWPVEIMDRMINLECREDMRIKSGARGGTSSGGVLQMGAQGIGGHLGTLPISQGGWAPPALLYLSGSEMWHLSLDTPPLGSISSWELRIHTCLVSTQGKLFRFKLSF